MPLFIWQGEHSGQKFENTKISIGLHRGHIAIVASGPRVKLASCKSALNPPMVYSTDHSKAVVPVLVLLFVALWFIVRGDLFYVLPCVFLFLCFLVLLA